ncbi:MAG: hypothetical protein ORN57_02415 [Alphaproteobacteria bacterium]|nr:hypothetical protein [Alphaproteobacteria bacterium]
MPKTILGKMQPKITPMVHYDTIIVFIKITQASARLLPSARFGIMVTI